MGAPMAMTAWSARMRKTRIEWALLAAVLGMFVPGFAGAETTGAVAANSGQAAPPPAARARPQAKPVPPSAKGGPRKAGLRPAVTTTPRPRPVTSNADPAASTTAARMQNTHAVTAVPHVATNARAAANVSRTPGSGAPGNTAGRRTSGPATIGGPARYDAKHGAVIGGTVTGRKR
jgi:hypothetical protein